MSIESMLECSFCQSEVIFCFISFASGNTSFVNKTGCQTIVFKWAVIFILAVTSIFSIFRLVPDYFFVVSLDDARNVVHAAVAHFHSVFIDDFMILWNL